LRSHIGNALRVFVSPQPGTHYVHYAANQLETAEDAAGTTNFTFDADGNQQLVVEPSGDRTTTTWNYENQPTLVQKPDGSRVTSVYNADNRRVETEE